MFDTLTLDELFALHDKLCAEHSARHWQFMAIEDPASPEARIVRARQIETDEMARAAYAEIVRRDVEHAHIYGRTDA